MGKQSFHLLIILMVLVGVTAACERVPKNKQISPNRWDNYYNDNDAGYRPPVPSTYPTYGDNDNGYYPPYSNELLLLNDDM